MARVMLVEDDEVIGGALASTLREERYEVRWCQSARAALESASEGSVDLVVLDLGLPDLNGVDVCRGLRRRLPDAVIVILSARNAEVDVVVGLEAGADDYLVKPVSAAEFAARVRAHLRRSSVPPGPADCVGSLRVDGATREAWLGKELLALRPKEFDLLARLTAEAGMAVGRSTLMSEVWDANWYGSTKTLDVHVAAVRKRLAQAEEATGLVAPQIITLRGFGYRLVVPGEDVSPEAVDDRDAPGRNGPAGL